MINIFVGARRNKRAVERLSILSRNDFEGEENEKKGAANMRNLYERARSRAVIGFAAISHRN